MESLTETNTNRTILSIISDKEFRPIWYIAAIFFILVTVPNFFGWYGYFCDELYYIACAKKLAFGYIDHPPFAPFILRIIGEIAGYSIIVIRILPALAGSAAIITTAIIARELGANRYALILSSLAVAINPAITIFSTFFSMNSFEILLWALLFLTGIKYLKSGNEKLWIIISIIIGLGINNKHTMALTAALVIAALFISKPMENIKSKYFWFGIGIILLSAVPNIVWQFQNNFYSLEFYKQATLNKNVPTSPIKAFIGQMIFMQPMAFLIWFTGLIGILTSKKLRRFLPLGIAAAILFLMFLFSNSSRPDRITGIYIFLFAVGSVIIADFFEKRNIKYVEKIYIAILTISALILLPYFNPILPPMTLEKYLSSIGLTMQIESNKKEIIPQWIGDRLGWEDIVKNVAEAYYKLPEDEKKDAAIISNNYSTSGAIDLFGEKYGIPKSIGTHNNYWLWGYGNWNGKVLLTVRFSKRDLQSSFETVEEVAKFDCSDAPSYMKNIRIYKAKKLKAPIDVLWKDAYNFR